MTENLPIIKKEEGDLMPETVEDSSEQSKPWQFKPGESGNPAGRPKDSFAGRHQALIVLDKVMAEAKNKKKLAEKFQDAFDSNPLAFFRTYIMPLLPRNINLKEDIEPVIIKIVKSYERDNI